MQDEERSSDEGHSHQGVVKNSKTLLRGAGRICTNAPFSPSLGGTIRVFDMPPPHSEINALDFSWGLYFWGHHFHYSAPFLQYAED